MIKVALDNHRRENEKWLDYDRLYFVDKEVQVYPQTLGYSLISLSCWMGGGSVSHACDQAASTLAPKLNSKIPQAPLYSSV